MQEVELTDGQEETLSALVDLSRHEETPIPGREIAETIDQNPGTIRNQIQSLKSLQLVEGIPGPKGGYKPTVEAYRILDRQSFDTPGKSDTCIRLHSIDLLPRLKTRESHHGISGRAWPYGFKTHTPQASLAW